PPLSSRDLSGLNAPYISCVLTGSENTRSRKTLILEFSHRFIELIVGKQEVERGAPKSLVSVGTKKGSGSEATSSSSCRCVIRSTRGARLNCMGHYDPNAGGIAAPNPGSPAPKTTQLCQCRLVVHR